MLLTPKPIQSDVYPKNTYLYLNFRLGSLSPFLADDLKPSRAYVTTTIYLNLLSSKVPVIRFECH